MSYKPEVERKMYGLYGDRNHTPTKFPEETLTQQNFKDSCDINHMMKKYQKTGILGDPNRPMPRFGDFSGGSDFHEMNTKVVRAFQDFNDLPGKVKAYFRNDPGELIEFLADESNREEAIKLGLIDPKKEGLQEPTPAAEPPIGDEKGTPKAAETGREKVVEEDKKEDISQY